MSKQTLKVVCPTIDDARKFITENFKDFQRLSFKISKNRGVDSVDVYAEAYLNMYKNIHTYDCKSEIHAWFSTIVMNVVRKHIKAKYRQNIENLSQTYIPKFESPSYAEVFRNEQIKLIKDYVDNLPPREKLIVNYYFFNHMTLTAIEQKIKNTPYAISKQRIQQIVDGFLIKAKKNLGRRLEIAG